MKPPAAPWVKPIVKGRSGKPALSRSLPREVRIIGGQWKRSKLTVADTPGLRPTPDRVRETLFNWLGQDLSGWRCVDAFAGSGALGFEAASRGAAEVLLVERDRGAVARLREAAERLKASTLRIEQADALAALARLPDQSLELVFLDPPFDAELHALALRGAWSKLVVGGYAYVEAGEACDAAAAASLGYRLHRHGRAGQVHFHLLQRAEPA